MNRKIQIFINFLTPEGRGPERGAGASSKLGIKLLPEGEVTPQLDGIGIPHPWQPPGPTRLPMALCQFLPAVLVVVAFPLAWKA